MLSGHYNVLSGHYNVLSGHYMYIDDTLPCIYSILTYVYIILRIYRSKAPPRPSVKSSSATPIKSSSDSAINSGMTPIKSSISSGSGSIGKPPLVPRRRPSLTPTTAPSGPQLSLPTRPIRVTMYNYGSPRGMLPLF